ncbi:maleate cis-trans isomerase [Candidatus Bathyarchaeota archaeon]|jgi:maleate isomerase|nr:maleate cis-trans isomerase [Candidatus Bathyarchaeota archaeon]|tara:strand:- start:195 stop:848 length:654 start_codon:yes stop_codon:yes gene_type:complete
MEPDFYTMAPRGVTVHTARMRLTKVTPEALIRMAEDTEMAAGLLADAGVEIIVYGCTTGSLVKGVEWEKGLMARIKKETGIPAVSTSIAVIEALRSLGARRLGVATPYSEELNGLEKSFLETFGFKVMEIRGLGILDNLGIGQVPKATLESIIWEVADDADAVFISCTNLPVVGLIEEFEKGLGKHVVTSNQASMWAALRGRVTPGLDGYGELMRKL